MRKLLLAILLVVIGKWVWAQQPYFIYLQTKEGQPFYIKLNGEVYSSSANGFFILPDLSDSSYEIFVGMPNTNSKEAKFTIGMDGKDHGFSIDVDENGLLLTDLQSGKRQSVTQNKSDKSIAGLTYIKRDDPFSILLSKYSGDTSLLYTVVYTPIDSTAIAKNTKQPGIKGEISGTSEIITPIDKGQVVTESTTKVESSLSDTALVVENSKSVLVRQDSLSKQPETINKDSSAEKAITNALNVESDTLNKRGVVDEFKRSIVSRFSESSTSEGFGLVFVDDLDGFKDTIRLLIPNPKIVFEKPDTVRQNEGFFLERNKDTNQAVTAPVTDTASMIIKKSQINSCKAAAGESDFFKLRKAMASKPTDEAMISEAQKIFRVKCFTTLQIKNLGALFLTNAGKYQFFSAAFNHVSDANSFPSLQAELTDTYYSGRFKALIEE